MSMALEKALRDALTGAAPIDAERVLVAHHQELPDPEKYRFASVMQGPWRLILRNDLLERDKPAVALYCLTQDPGQRADVARMHPDVVANLRRRYETWWGELAGGFMQRGYFEKRGIASVAPEQ